jgi:folate-dependent phosphoribosylglycinamide formyltransferase PurN
MSASGMATKKIVLLGGGGDYPSVVYNFIAERFAVAAVILEPPTGGWALARGRMRRLGVRRTFGQIVFRVAIFPLLAFASRARRAELMREKGLSAAPLAPEKVTHVPSANSPECVAALTALAPDIVIVAGTRILAKETLAAAPAAAWVNIHAGITPLYRGVHGAYWALAEKDAAHCGVTVHLVDAGIDTGGILAQAPITIAARDNFATYGIVQNAAGLALLRDAVLPRLLAGDRSTQPAPAGTSRLWSHPTAWEYLRHRVRGVK